jgi:hypothetical protein
MARVEIIANHSVEENILDALAQEGVGKFYTKYANVFGVGSSGPRMGDAIWPEENFAMIIWCEEEEARGIARAVAAVKKQFPDEGIRVFGLPEQVSRFPSYQSPGQALAPAQPEAPEPRRAVPPVYPAAEPAPPSAAPPVSGPPVSAPPLPAKAPPAPLAPDSSGIDRGYDGQNMDEEH